MPACLVHVSTCVDQAVTTAVSDKAHSFHPSLQTKYMPCTLQCIHRHYVKCAAPFSGCIELHCTYWQPQTQHTDPKPVLPNYTHFGRDLDHASSLQQPCAQVSPPDTCRCSLTGDSQTPLFLDTEPAHTPASDSLFLGWLSVRPAC